MRTARRRGCTSTPLYVPRAEAEKEDACHSYRRRIRQQWEQEVMRESRSLTAVVMTIRAMVCPLHMVRAGDEVVRTNMTFGGSRLITP